MKIITKISYPAFALFAIASTVLPKIQAAGEPAAPCAQCLPNNTAEGKQALAGITTGAFNTAVGNQALRSLTTGNYNTAIGWYGLCFATGDDNVAIGALALASDTVGSQNVANGTAALTQDTTGGGNGLSAKTPLLLMLAEAIMWLSATARSTLGAATKISRWAISPAPIQGAAAATSILARKCSAIAGIPTGPI